VKRASHSHTHTQTSDFISHVLCPACVRSPSMLSVSLLFTVPVSSSGYECVCVCVCLCVCVSVLEVTSLTVSAES